MSALTIGLPVYNGEATLERTLKALLSQTYEDFTLLVSDNASIDATPEILNDYASSDPRLRIVRQTQNIGAGKNFWHLIQLARTPLFGWCAADDVPQPSYLEKCIAGLNGAPGALICCTDVIFVLHNGERFRYHENLDTVGCDIEDRLHRLFRRNEWYAVYGVGRRDRMMSCGPSRPRYGGDVTWTAEWSCLWEVACVHEPLLHFSYGPRDPARYAAAEADGGPIADRPLSQMLGDIGAAVQRRAGTEVSPRRLMIAMARTLAFENPSLSNSIFSENAVSATTLNDYQRLAFFYRLFSAGDRPAEL